MRPGALPVLCAEPLAEYSFCIGTFMSMKGLRPGQRSFDERTWLELGEY